MTDYIEINTDPGNAFADSFSFGAAVDPVEGDTWSGSLGPRNPVVTDIFDEFSINVAAGTTYTFTLTFTSLTGDYFAMQAGGTFVTNASTVTNDPGALSLTFSFVAASNMEQDFGILTGGAAGEYVVNLTTVAPAIAGPTIGDDVLFGGDGPTVIDLLGGNDTWTGVDTTTAFEIGKYIDRVRGGFGDDSIFGGIGNDRIWGDQDNDLLDFGDGNDNGWGGEGDDMMFGGSGSDRVNGNSGDDSLFGGSGGDIMRGGKGEDYIDGGDQADQIWGGAQTDEIYGGKGADVIYGQQGADLIFGGSGGDMINGGSFDDVLHGDHGNDTVNGGSGDDTLYGGKSDDKLNGNSGDDSLFGGNGDDRLTGGVGNDYLDGGTQTDRLIGGDGNDILIGGKGDDMLTGGAMADTFVFADVVNMDVITDFELGLDKIDLAAYGPIADVDLLSMISDVDGNALIDLGQWGEVTVTGVAAADLTLENFIYLPDELILLPVDVPEEIFVVG